MATLVAPRLTPTAASLNRTNTRLTAGTKGTLPSPCTKTAKVGVSPVAISVVTAVPAEPRQIPVVESVRQIVSATGSATFPVSTEVVIEPPAPTFTAATEKAPIPVGPGMLTLPSVVSVATSDTMSGTGVDDADSRNVLTPTITGAGSVFPQSNCSTTF